MRKKKIEEIPAYSSEVKDILTRFSNREGVSAAVGRRATIILLASEGIPGIDIAAKCDLHYNNVSIWCDRFRKGLPQIEEAEASGDNLEQAVLKVLSDKKRPGPVSRFSQEQIDRIAELAKEEPAKYGYRPSDHWDLYCLAAEAAKQGIVKEISPASIRRYVLKK